MHHPLRLLLVVAMVGWLFATPVAAATTTASTQSQVTLTVSVVDQGGAPIGNADLTASWDGGETSGTTASNGRAFLDVPEGADVTITVEHEDYVRNKPLVVGGATEQDVTVRVSLKGHSTVEVTDSEGEPLEDATVELRRNGNTVVSGTTNESGTFESGVVEQGRYEFHAVKPGYLRESMESRVGVDSREEFELERGRIQLEVTVIDDHFEEPRTLEDARVRLTDSEGEVATVRTSGGTASLSVDVNNIYSVTVLKEGYVESGTRIRVRERDRSVEAATQRVPELRVLPQNSRVVVGEETRIRVVNAYDEPVEGADVRYGGESVGETDANGEVVVTVQAEGPQEFRAVHDGVESEPVSIEGINPDADDDDDTENTPTETEAAAPGFGALAALLAILGAVLLARR